MKFAFTASAALVLAAIGLASCGSSDSENAAQPTNATPEVPGGIAVTDGRLVLPAVKGNPGAAYFTITNGGDTDTAIAGAFVEGAKSAMLHTSVQTGGISSMKEMSDLPVAKGATVKFAPGGNHVMAMDLSDSVQPGDTIEVTLTFSDGDKATFPAAVLSAGDAR